jgi:uncharacterized membrane protein
LPNIHPIVVHFPIALIFAVIVVDLVGRITKNDSYLRVGTILTIFALAGALAAVGTGLFAEESVWHSEAAEELIETHELLGFVYLGILTLLTIVRLAAIRKLGGSTGWVAITIAVLAAGVVTFGAYFGGELVYQHGTGVTGVQMQTLDSDGDEQGLDEEFEDEEEASEETEKDE